MSDLHVNFFMCLCLCVFLARAKVPRSMSDFVTQFVSPCVFTAAAGSAEVVIMLKNCGGQADGRAGKVLDTFIRVPSWVMHDTSCIMHHASCIMYHESCIMRYASCVMHYAL